MRTFLQEPVQSLPSQKRYFSGEGSATPSPVFFMMIACMMFIAIHQSMAGDGIPRNGSEENRLDQLFERMIDEMPAETKNEVDSASSAKMGRLHLKNRSAKLAKEPGEKEKGDVTTRLNELPEDLRLRVERSITDIKERNELRKAKFREFRKEKQ